MTLKDKLLNNLSWKVLSLALATMIWFTVSPTTHTDPSSTAGLIRNFETREIPGVAVLATGRSGATGVQVDPATVTVTVRAEEDIMSEFNPRDIVASVRVSDLPDQRTLRRVLVSVPPGVTLVSVLPPSVAVERLHLPGEGGGTPAPAPAQR